MIKRAKEWDTGHLASLAIRMWQDHTAEELAAEFTETMQQEDAAFFLYMEGELPVGFAQCQLRHDYVEGTDSSPVGYLEGILVREEYRRRGYARELLAACESWAREKGCVEFASDCQADNEESFFFHRAVGFAEAGRIICFTKSLCCPGRQ